MHAVEITFTHISDERPHARGLHLKLPDSWMEDTHVAVRVSQEGNFRVHSLCLNSEQRDAHDFPPSDLKMVIAETLRRRDMLEEIRTRFPDHRVNHLIEVVTGYINENGGTEAAADTTTAFRDRSLVKPRSRYVDPSRPALAEETKSVVVHHTFGKRGP